MPSLFKKGDWVKYKDEIYQIEGVEFNQALQENIYYISSHRSNIINSIAKPEAKKRFIKV